MASNRTRLMIKTAAATLAAAAGLGVLGAWLVLERGWYHIGANNQHWQAAHTVLERGMRESARHYARDVAVPQLDQPARVGRGAALYRDNGSVALFGKRRNCPRMEHRPSSWTDLSCQRVKLAGE